MKTTSIKNRNRKTQLPRPDCVQFTLRRSQLIGAAVIASSGMIALAATVPNSFTSGSPAVAADVNANFQALVTALTTAENTISSLQSTVTSLQSSLTAVQSNITTLQSGLTTSQANITTLQSGLVTANSNVSSLQTKLANVSTLTVNGQPTVRFTGVNVQVVNGAGTSGAVNGTGNFIVGYDESDYSGIYRCTRGLNPQYLTIVTDATSCSSAGGIWTSAGFKTGSHNIVVGSQHNYSQSGGVIFGVRNTVNAYSASVVGGYENTASGHYATVAGGTLNSALELYTSVSGGASNSVTGRYASISGGDYNTASGQYASVSGGNGNTGSGIHSSVSGGANNTASGQYGSVSGGVNNIASGQFASVSGGSTRYAYTQSDWAAGALWQDF